MTSAPGLGVCKDTAQKDVPLFAVTSFGSPVGDPYPTDDSGIRMGTAATHFAKLN